MIQETQSVENQSSINLAVKDSSEKHLISDVHFQQLMALRDEVYQSTQVNPSIRKLLYLIIEKANLDTIREQLIQQYA